MIHFVIILQWAQLVIVCAENDSYAPTEMINNLNNYLKKLNIKYKIETYHGTGHGFVFPQRVGLYDKNAAEKHWQRLLGLFNRNLNET